jgi:hypothetical protein
VAAKLRHDADRDALTAQRDAVAHQRRALDAWCVAEGHAALSLEQVACDAHGSTALIRACGQGENALAAELISRLRRSGLDRAAVTKELNRAAANDGHTALTKACAANDLVMVRASPSRLQLTLSRSLSRSFARSVCFFGLADRMRYIV